MLAEVAPASAAPEKLIVMFVATLCERLVKVATPLAAIMLNVPCNRPLPALRAAVMTVLLSELTRFPNGSSIRTAGCCAKTTPAIAVAEGWVCMVNLLAAPGLMAMAPEVAPAQPLLANAMGVLVATFAGRF